MHSARPGLRRRLHRDRRARLAERGVNGDALGVAEEVVEARAADDPDVRPHELAKAYDAYSFKVIPQVGEWVAKDRDAYQYLVESIRRFPDQRTFAAMIEAAGFKRVTFTNFTGGVAALHQGWAI